MTGCWRNIPRRSCWCEIVTNPRRHHTAIPVTREQSPLAVHAGHQTASLPLSPKLTGADAERVIDTVSGIVLSHR